MLDLERNMLQSPPWIQVRQEHRGFQPRQWNPELPVGQGNHAHQGHPVRQVKNS